MAPKIAIPFALFLTLTVATGCAVQDKAKPMPTTFLQGVPLESKIERVPFEHAWKRPGDIRIGIDSIYVKPIRTDLVPADSWVHSSGVTLTSAQDFNKEVAEVAVYFKEQLNLELKKAFEKTKRLKIATAPSAHTVTLEIALTEVVLSRPASSAASLASPIPGTGLALSTLHNPHLAFAARFVGPDGTLLATVADRRFPPKRIIDLNKLTLTSSAREIVAQWARELAEAIEFDKNSPIEKSTSISLLPW